LGGALTEEIAARVSDAPDPAPDPCAAMLGPDARMIPARDASALRDEAAIRFALSGDGDPGDQPGSRERPIPGAVALRRAREAERSRSFEP